MHRLTEWQNGELLVKEEERLLDANGAITKDEMYKIMRHLAEKLASCEDCAEIFEKNFSTEALEILNNKEEFSKWLERVRWSSKGLDEVSRELQTLKDKQERGALLVPKVVLDSLVYMDSTYWGILPYKVSQISYSKCGFCYEVSAVKDGDLLDAQEITDDDFGKFAFLTEEEAEKALAKKSIGRTRNDDSAA